MTKVTLMMTILLGVVVATIIATSEKETGGLASSHGDEFLIDEGAAKQNDHLRFRRLTCDTGLVGDTLCGADCLTKGKTSGSCVAGICICSSDTISDAIGV